MKKGYNKNPLYSSRGYAFSIYVLELENNLIYVGKSTEVGLRLNRHFNGSGCNFTRLFKPRKVLKIYQVKDYNLLYLYELLIFSSIVSNLNSAEKVRGSCFADCYYSKDILDFIYYTSKKVILENKDFDLDKFDLTNNLIKKGWCVKKPATLNNKYYIYDFKKLIKRIHI